MVFVIILITCLLRLHPSRELSPKNSLDFATKSDGYLLLHITEAKIS